MSVPENRIRGLNDQVVRPDADYVVYWMVACRRLESNFALEYAAARAYEWRKPLIILEALRCDYPWASDRLHTFVIDGMADHAEALVGAEQIHREKSRTGPGPAAPASCICTMTTR